MRRAIFPFISSEISGHVVSITGSGGKTSLMIGMANYAKSIGKSVLMTTTTKLRSPHLMDYGCDQVFMDRMITSYSVKKGESVLFASTFLPKKVGAPDLNTLELLIPIFDLVLIESDGSRQLPLKLHQEKDPVVLTQTTTTIAMAGLGGWGAPATEENFFNINDDCRERLLDEDMIRYLLLREDGLLKGAVGKTMVLLNQAEKADIDMSKVRDFCGGSCSDNYGNIYAASIKENWIEV